MKNLRILSLMSVLLFTAFTFTSCSKDEDDPMPTNNNMSKSIVETATSDAQFSILVDALVRANLVDALNGAGPFTVFAPTNQAFEQLFAELGVSSINEVPMEILTPVLLYHVVSAKATSADLSTGYINTISNATQDGLGIVAYISTEGGVMINNSVKVTTADIMATNGVIHVIDKVMLPPTVVDIAIANSAFSILVEAVVKAGLVDALKAAGPFTVFAPTNDAFEALFATLGVGGVADLTAEQLTPILLYHVVPDNVISTEVSTGMVPTLNTEAMIDITVDNMGVMLDNSAKVTAVDIQANNGVIHVIDKVILP
jgi:transforming growth factor-beta-induced protein